LGQTSGRHIERQKWRQTFHKLDLPADGEDDDGVRCAGGGKKEIPGSPTGTGLRKGRRSGKKSEQKRTRFPRDRLLKVSAIKERRLENKKTWKERWAKGWTKGLLYEN